MKLARTLAPLLTALPSLLAWTTPLAAQEVTPGSPEVGYPRPDPSGPLPPHLLDGPVCKLPKVGPEYDRLLYTGSELSGDSSVSFTGGVYRLRYEGDEVIEYQIDLNDFAVATGFLRVYEATSDAYPVAGGGPAFRDAGGTLRDTWWLSQNTVLVDTEYDRTSVTLTYEDHVDGVHRRKHRFELIGKSLRIRVWDDLGNTSFTANYAGVELGHTEDTDAPRLVRMQGTLASPIVLYENGDEHFYCANQLDLLWSNASTWDLPPGDAVVPGATSVDFSYSTADEYKVLSDGSIAAPLDDSFNIIVSSRIQDVLVTSSTPASPYRTALTHRMVVMFTGFFTSWEDYKAELELFERWGMRNLAAYFFSWWSSTNDGDATHYPAKDEAAYIDMRQSPAARNILVGEYTKYWKNWGGSPTFSVYEIPLTDTLAPKDTNIVEGARIAKAVDECAQLKAAYGSNLGYQDVLTYASPSRGIGTDSITQHHASPFSKTLRDACIDRKIWLKAMQDILDGPLLGEASIATQSSNMEFLWMGYVDSVQRTINSGAGAVSGDLPDGHPLAPTLWPVIPEYEWRVSATRQVNHGNAFYTRFFSWADADLFPTGVAPSYPLPEAALDRYRVYEVTYGHSAFVQTNGPFDGLGDYMPYSDIVKEYYLMNGLQERSFTSEIRSISYRWGGELRSFDDIIAITETTETFVDPRIRIELENGLILLVNHHPQAWDPDLPGVDVTIPEDGFFAHQPGTDFVAFSAIPDGGSDRIDYAFVPDEYEMLDGRGAVLSHGNLSTTNGKLLVHIVPMNRTLWEDDLGKMVIQDGETPTLQSITLAVTDPVITLGERTGVRATGHFSNGGVRDMTTLMTLTSADPKIAEVTPGAAVLSRCSGETMIRAEVHLGITPVPVAVTVLP